MSKPLVIIIGVIFLLCCICFGCAWLDGRARAWGILPTYTPTLTATITPAPTVTLTPTRTPRSTRVPTRTATPYPTRTSTPYPTYTPRPAVPTHTPVAAPATQNTPAPTSAPVAPEPPVAAYWHCPETTEGAAYAGSSTSDKFHIPSCRHARNIAPGNRICFSSRQAALNSGYIPCGVCKP